jgi:predicted nuclease with TOPRIM domain
MPLEELTNVLNKLIRNYEKEKRRKEELEKQISLYKEREKMLEKKVIELEKRLRELLNRFSLIEK